MQNTLDITAPNGKSYKMPWSKSEDPTEADIDAFIEAQEKSGPNLTSLITGEQEPKKSLWEKANTGIIPVTKLTNPVAEVLYKYGESGKPLSALEKAYKFVTDSASEYAAPGVGKLGPSINPDPRGVGMQLGAMTQGVGQATEDFTSPVNLALGGIGSVSSFAAKQAGRAIPATKNLTDGIIQARGAGNKVLAEKLAQELAIARKSAGSANAVGQVSKVATKGAGGAMAANALYQGVEDKDWNQALPFFLGALGAFSGRFKPVKKLGINNPRTSPTPPSVPKINHDAILAQKLSEAEALNTKNSLVDKLKQTFGVETTTSNVAPSLPKSDAKLPRELAGAKPRYNIRDKVWLPIFESDIDKAAYIIANKNTSSKQHTAYLNFLVKNTGMSEAEAFDFAIKVKGHVKSTLAGKAEGSVAIPKFQVPVPVTPIPAVLSQVPPVVPNQAPVIPPVPVTPIPAPETPYTKILENANKTLPEQPKLGKTELVNAEVTKEAIKLRPKFTRNSETEGVLKNPNKDALAIADKEGWSVAGTNEDGSLNMVKDTGPFEPIESTIPEISSGVKNVEPIQGTEAKIRELLKKKGAKGIQDVAPLSPKGQSNLIQPVAPNGLSQALRDMADLGDRFVPTGKVITTKIRGLADELESNPTPENIVKAQSLLQKDKSGKSLSEKLKGMFGNEKGAVGKDISGLRANVGDEVNRGKGPLGNFGNQIGAVGDLSKLKARAEGTFANDPPRHGREIFDRDVSADVYNGLDWEQNLSKRDETNDLIGDFYTRRGYKAVTFTSTLAERRGLEERLKALPEKGSISPDSKRGRALEKQRNDLVNRINTLIDEGMKNPERGAIVFNPQGIRESIKKNLGEHPIVNTMGMFKSATAGMDLSAPLRQGRLLSHKKEFWTSLGPMLKSARSEAGFQKVQESILNNSDFDLAVKSKLALTSLSDNLTGREEAIMSNLPEKIPIVGRAYRGSNRAYTGFLNKLRMDTFSSLLRDAERMGRNVDDQELTNAIAKFINNATGRGSLGGLEAASKSLNAVFFSPRFVSSRLAQFNPVAYVKADPFVRKEMIRSILAYTTSQAAVLSLAALGGAQVEWKDMTNADFGKIKIGNTRIDTTSGLGPYSKFAAQMIQGRIRSSTTGKDIKLNTGKFGAPSRFSIMEDFGINRSAPIPSWFFDQMRGETSGGDKLNWENHFFDKFTPMLYQDLRDIYREDPSLLPAGLPAAFGASVQTYEKKGSKKSPFALPRMGK